MRTTKKQLEEQIDHLKEQMQNLKESKEALFELKRKPKYMPMFVYIWLLLKVCRPYRERSGLQGWGNWLSTDENIDAISQAIAAALYK